MKLDMEDRLALGPTPRTCSKTVSHCPGPVMTVTRRLRSIKVVWRPHPLLSFLSLCHCVCHHMGPPPQTLRLFVFWLIVSPRFSLNLVSSPPFILVLSAILLIGPAHVFTPLHRSLTSCHYVLTHGSVLGVGYGGHKTCGC